MLQASMGNNYLAERSQWQLTGNARKDESSATSAPVHIASQTRPASAMGQRWPARRGLDLGCVREEWPCRTVQPEKATSESVERFKGAPIRVVQPATYIPYQARGEWMRRVDASPHRRAQFDCHI